jgi:diguanylate cyclase (GGDEF)-like protein/PAS domain S-box-containing protein
MKNINDIEVLSLKRINNQVIRKNIFKPIIATTLVMIAILIYYIPYVSDKNSISTITKNSLQSVEQIKLTRAYYVNSVVKDIKKNAPNIKFSYEHEGVNGIIPLPTTTIHDLSKIFSENTGIRYALYSEFPFKNRADRVLTDFEKEAIKYTKKNPDGTYVKKDTIDGKPVIRVAVTDFMTDKACVSCHNSHPDRTWEVGKWKLGDKRGVIEVITPLEDVIEANNKVKYSILALIVAMILSLLGYFYHIFVRRESELVQTIGATSSALEKEIETSDKQEFLIKEHKKALDKSAIVSRTDTDGIITYASEKFCEISGYSQDELVGRSHNIIQDPDSKSEDFKELWETISSKQVYKGTLKNISKDKKAYYVDTTIVPFLNKDGTILEYMSISYDVTSHIQALHYAYTDNLTKVHNRNKFEEVFAYELKQTKRYGSTFTLAILDIDHFKNINDTYGHLVGDEILIMLAKSVNQNIRESDFFARWGGEEFVLLMNNSTLESTTVALENLKKVIESLNHNIAKTVTASFGFTQVTDKDTLESALNRADKALYEAKDDGRNCIKST